MKPEDIEVAIYCEESQEVCKAFRALGFRAFSYDLQPCSGGHPEWHVQGDIREYIQKPVHLAIFHPTCKFIANSGVRWLGNNSIRYDMLKEAMKFFNLRHVINSKYVATENPIPHKYARIGLGDDNELTYLGSTKGIGKYDQLFQPWHFGHKEMKATCLWLKGLPKLEYTEIVGPPPKDKKERELWAKVHRMSPGPERERLRSKTYSGVAQAMAQQWGKFLLCTGRGRDRNYL